jgi:hypothetical protein
LSGGVPAQSSASADSTAVHALTIEFEIDAPVLNSGAARVLLDLLLAADREGVVDSAASGGHEDQPDRHRR